MKCKVCGKRIKLVSDKKYLVVKEKKCVGFFSTNGV